MSLKAFATVALLASATVAGAQTQTPAPDLSVVVASGEAVVKRAPDRAFVSIAAESRARTSRDAQLVNAEAMTAVLAKLKSAGIPGDAIQTTGYDIQPEFDYANGKQTVRGYVARNSIEVRVDELPKLGDILDIAVGAGATSVAGVRFDLKDRTGAEREALRRAVEDARARADAAAAGAGLKVDRVVRIEEQRANVMPAAAPCNGDARRGAGANDAGRCRRAGDSRRGYADGSRSLKSAVLHDNAIHRVIVEQAEKLRRAHRTSGLVDRSELRKRFGCADSAVFQPARRHEHAALERTNRAVVRVD